MNEEKLQKLLKKYDIQGNKSQEEIIELLEIKWDELLERQNRTKDDKIGEEIDLISEAIEFLKSNIDSQKTFLTEIVKEDKINNNLNNNFNKIADLKGDFSDNQKSTVTPIRNSAAAGGNVGNVGNAGSGNQGSVVTNAPSASGKLWFTSVTGDITVNNMFVQVEDGLNYGQWDMVDRIVDNILLVEPKNASAFMAKAMVEYQIKKVQQFAEEVDNSWESNVNIRKAEDFGNSQQAKYIRDMKEERRQFIIYKEAFCYVNSDDKLMLLNSASKFQSINGYRDSTAQAEKCRKRAIAIEETERLEKIKTIVNEYISKSKECDSTDYQTREKLLNELKEYLEKEPEAKRYIENNDLKELQQGIEEAKKEAQKAHEQYKREKRRDGIANIFAFILLIVSILLGTVGYFGYGGEEKTGIWGYTPISITCDSAEYTDSNTSYVFGLGKVEYISIKRCDNIKYIIMPNTEPYRLYIENTTNEKIEVPIGARSVRIENCEELKMLLIPEGVESLSVINCSELNELVLPEGIKEIAIDGCSKLSELVLPKGVEEVSISEVETETLKITGEVENVVIYSCDITEEVYISDGVKSVRFGQVKVGKVSLPNKEIIFKEQGGLEEIEWRE